MIYVLVREHGMKESACLWIWD